MKKCVIKAMLRGLLPIDNCKGRWEIEVLLYKGIWCATRTAIKE